MQIIDAASGIKVYIHFIERTVHGNGIGIKVYGEMLTYGDLIIQAHELKLNTLEELQLTPMGSDQAYMANKYIVDKGLYGNEASIHVYDESWNPIDGTNKGPEAEGSIFLDFEALGE